jgi:hypothetical protein
MQIVIEGTVGDSQKAAKIAESSVRLINAAPHRRTR